MAAALALTVAKEHGKRRLRAVALGPPVALERQRWRGAADALSKLVGDVVVWQVPYISFSQPLPRL